MEASYQSAQEKSREFEAKLETERGKTAQVLRGKGERGREEGRRGEGRKMDNGEYYFCEKDVPEKRRGGRGGTKCGGGRISIL